MSPAKSVLEDNMRVANFELSTNTLTIGIYQKCDGMLEKTPSTRKITVGSR